MPIMGLRRLGPRNRIKDYHIDQFVDALEGLADAYDVAVADGFTGTRGAWLQSLKGKDGASNSAALSRPYRILWVIPTAYDLPESGGKVTASAAAMQVALDGAVSFPARMDTFSAGMADIRVTPLVWGTEVPAEAYTVSGEGYYPDPDRMRPLLAAGGVAVDGYDAIAIIADPEATTRDDGNVIGVTNLYGWWAPATSGGIQACPHEFAHLMERHLRSVGYTNLPTCSGASTNGSIHCGNDYGYPSNINDTWYTAWFSATVPDGSGMSAEAWALPTPAEVRAGDQGVILHDSYSGASGLLQDHTPGRGYGWTRMPGTVDATITPDGRVRSTGSSGGSVAAYRASAWPTTDTTVITARVYVASTGSGTAGVMARWQEGTSGTYYHARLNLSGSVQLYRFHDALGNSSLGSVPWTPVAGATVELKLTLAGNLQLVAVDGVTVITSNNTDIPDRGQVGIRFVGSATDATGLHIASVTAWGSA